MPIAFKKNGKLDCKKLTREEAAAVDRFLEEMQVHFHNQGRAAENILALPDAPQEYVKQLAYARHGWQALEWCRAMLHQKRASRQTAGAHRGRQAKSKSR